ncbi:hypothetical protein NIES4071_81810 [Calothrix sp. NIES-4071]|nr:hypothetical protein NIES4071_81810 [Calothrix sp. NIES-4071]BAZ62450.1 hypothetical protein NIES4105_81740 [Calothrix sp. NIES-4105]
MEFTLNIPEELAIRLNLVGDKLPQVIELGLRELNASSQTGLSGVTQILEFLAQLPTPEEILALRPSEELQVQIDALLEKNCNCGLTLEEEQMWKQYEYLEHLVRIAKAKALLKLSNQ